MHPASAFQETSSPRMVTGVEAAILIVPDAETVRSNREMGRRIVDHKSYN